MRPGTRPLLPFAPWVLTRRQAFPRPGWGVAAPRTGPNLYWETLKKNPPTALQTEIPRPKITGKEKPASRHWLPACQAFASDIVREQGVQERCRPQSQILRPPRLRDRPRRPFPPKPYLGSPQSLARSPPTSRPRVPARRPAPARAPPPLGPRPLRPQRGRRRSQWGGGVARRRL